MTNSPTLILHIGHFKTGTTVLQNFFVNNFELLAKQGLVYAEEPIHNFKHSALALSLLRDAGVTTLMHGFSSPAGTAAHWQPLFAATRALPQGHAMLVSSEEFIRLGAYPAAVEQLRAQIDTARDLRFRVIVYLRPPHEQLTSWYNQLVKSGLEDAGFDTVTLSRTEPVHWDYAMAIRPWVEIFGHDAVVIRAFQPSLRQNNGIFNDFLTSLGYSIPAGATTMIKDPNPRLDDRLLAFRRGAGRAGVHPYFSDNLIELAVRGLQAEATADAPQRRYEDLRSEAEAGIAAVAALPGASLDIERMRADLPRGQDPLERRLDETVAILAEELVRLRARVARQAARIRVLEGNTGDAQTADSESD